MFPVQEVVDPVSKYTRHPLTAHTSGVDTRSRTYTLPHINTHTPTHKQTHTHAPSLTFTHTHSLTHSHAHPSQSSV